jgi:hypothetical protein
MRHIGKSTRALLVSVGPVIEVMLAPTKAAAQAFADAGKQIKIIKARLMIDTGAQCTVIEDRIASELGLSPIRFRPIVGVSQKAELRPVYPIIIRIAVEDKWNKGMIEFGTTVAGIESPQHQAGHVGLLGRDFLQHVICL